MVTDTACPPIVNKQTGPITIHCAAKLSAQCNYINSGHGNCKTSLHFNGHFPGGPGLAASILDFIGAKGVAVVVTTGAIRRAKLQSPINQHQFFYRLDALPVVQ